jgi:aspartyl-tRNA(Asn)/glutamyl-tRNA(Gln) amidotransferase subunit A
MYAATRAAGFGAEVKRRIMIGTYVLSAGFYDAYFNQAQKVRALIARDFERLRAVRPAPDARPRRRPPSGSARRGRSDRHVPERRVRGARQPRRPAGDVGARGLDAQGLPLGLQLIGRALDEQGVLNAGLAIEERAGFTARRRQWW